MTDAPLDQAMALAKQLRHAVMSAMEIPLAQALAAARQAVWEEVATYFEGEAERFDHIDDGEADMIRAFAQHCRTKAQAQERGGGDVS